VSQKGPARQSETDIEGFAKRLLKNDPAGARLLFDAITLDDRRALRDLAAILERELGDIPEFLRRSPTVAAP